MASGSGIACCWTSSHSSEDGGDDVIGVVGRLTATMVRSVFIRKGY